MTSLRKMKETRIILLAGDIGGTKTRLGLFSCPLRKAIQIINLQGRGNSLCHWCKGGSGSGVEVA
jgi:hypothetical protein